MSAQPAQVVITRHIQITSLRHRASGVGCRFEKRCLFDGKWIGQVRLCQQDLLPGLKRTELPLSVSQALPGGIILRALFGIANQRFVYGIAVVLFNEAP